MVEKMRLLFRPIKLTCEFIVPDIEKSDGVQKVIGFSRGWHHWNSIRLGYNRSENTNFVRLFLYAYVKGKRNEQLITTVKVGTKVDVELSFKHHVFAAIIRGKFGQYSKVEYAPIYFPIGYQLFPYAEIDGTEIRSKFNPDIRDVVVR